MPSEGVGDIIFIDKVFDNLKGGDDLIRHIFRDAPLIKLVCIGWAVVAFYTLAEMARADINLIINIIRFSVIAFFALEALRGLIFFVLKTLKVPDKIYKGHRVWNKLVFAAFSLAVVSTFFYSALISGHWISDYKPIPSSCFLNIQIHHHDWSLPFLIGIAYVAFAMKDAIKFRCHAKWAFRAAVVLILLFVVFSLFNGWFPNSSGFWRVNIALIGFCLVFGAVLKFGNIESLWFAIFMALSLGVISGVFIEGFSGVFRAEELRDGLSLLVAGCS